MLKTHRRQPEEREPKKKRRPGNVLIALGRHLLDTEKFATLADFVDTLKTRADQLQIPYDDDSVADAFAVLWPRIRYRRETS